MPMSLRWLSPKWRYRLRRHLAGLLAGVALAAIIVAAIAAPILSPHDPQQQHPELQLQPPSSAHPFGTDYLGRDVLSRVIWGARSSLAVSFGAVALGTTIGTVIGLCSGYWGGWLDTASQRIIDVFMALPGTVLALAIVAVLGASTFNLILTIALLVIPGVNRVVRGSVLQVKELQYVEAARALGQSDWRIMFGHILPNVLAPVLIMATSTLGNAVLIEASLSFLGQGTPPPAPSWGAMLSGEARTWFERAQWMALFPGLALTFTVVTFNMFGDFLRDVLDPKFKAKA